MTRGRLRVRVLTDPWGWGGCELHAVDLVRFLDSRGHDCALVALGSDLFHERLGPSPGIALERLPLPRPTDEVGFLRWRRLLGALGADVAILEKGSVYTGSLALDLAARLAFRRYITIEQLTPPPRPVRRRGRHLGGLLPGLGLWWHQHMLGVRIRGLAPETIVTVSEAIRRDLVEDYGFPADKVIAAPNGIETERYRPDDAGRSRARRAWGMPDTATVFGSVTRLANGHKGLDTAVAAFAALCRRHPEADLRLVLVGEGPDRDELIQQVEDEGIAGRAVFPGFSDRPWEAHCGIDFFLMPSRIEGIGLALMEAMASGTPPIAMATGGIPEVLSDRALGWLVPTGDRGAFLAAMEEALRLPADERTAMGLRARAHVVDRFDVGRQFSTLARLVEGERVST